MEVTRPLMKKDLGLRRAALPRKPAPARRSPADAAGGIASSTAGAAGDRLNATAIGGGQARDTRPSPSFAASVECRRRLNGVSCGMTGQPRLWDLGTGGASFSLPARHRRTGGAKPVALSGLLIWSSSGRHLAIRVGCGTVVAPQAPTQAVGFAQKDHATRSRALLGRDT